MGIIPLFFFFPPLSVSPVPSLVFSSCLPHSSLHLCFFLRPPLPVSENQFSVSIYWKPWLTHLWVGEGWLLVCISLQKHRKMCGLYLSRSSSTQPLFSTVLCQCWRKFRLHYHYVIGGNALAGLYFFQLIKTVLGGAKPRMQWWRPLKLAFEGVHNNRDWEQ